MQNLSRLFRLDHVTIDQEVTRVSAGVYALDRSSQGPFHPTYVGRSEVNLNETLHAQVDGSRFFKFAYCQSARAAFDAECGLYHEYRPAENAEHPRNAQGWPCPVCGNGA